MRVPFQVTVPGGVLDSARPCGKLRSINYTSEFDLPQGEGAGLSSPTAVGVSRKHTDACGEACGGDEPDPRRAGWAQPSVCIVR